MSLNHNLEKSDQLISNLMELAISFLDGRLSCSGKSETSVLVNGGACSYFYSITRVDLNTIILHENIVAMDNQNHTARNWIFSNNQKWTVSGAEKNGSSLDKGSIEIELNDTLSRLENIKKGKAGTLDVPFRNNGNGFIPVDFARRKINHFTLLIVVSVMMCGFFTALIFNSFGFRRISGIVDGLDQAIENSTDLNKRAINDLSVEFDIVQTELILLKSSVAQEKEAFLFSRQNTASNIRRMAKELPRKYNSRKKAYNFLAVLVESSSTYGDLIYHVSRLPQNEAQAETLLATDVSNVITLDSYSLAFSNLVYPVRLDGKENDGKSFLISSDYMEKRVSPIGTGGVNPHYAIDIININNIIDITTENKIIRAIGLPGIIVSVADGVIRNICNSSVYGWNVEVEHPLTEEILAKYPKAEKWTTFYAHMNKPTSWNNEDVVKQNVKIGDIGEAGRSTGPHLHFEIRIYSSLGKNLGIFGKYDKINPTVRVDSRVRE